MESAGKPGPSDCDGRVNKRGEGDEDRDAVVADELVAAAQFEQQRGGSEGRKALEDRGQRKAFERVAQSGLSCGCGDGNGRSP